MEENYEDEDKTSNRFSADFGFGYDDHDFVEMNTSDTGPKTLNDFLPDHSCSGLFMEDVAVVAQERGVADTELVFLMYDFAYDPAVTSASRSEYLLFLGCFDYDEGAPTARQLE